MRSLLDPYSFAFFRHGVAVATVAGALCGLLGVFVVLRGLSYLGHGLSHAIFGGAAASALVSTNFYAGAGAWGVASALAIGRLGRRRGIGGDAAIGVVTTASFAFGVALLGLYGQVRRSLDASLFGSVLGVSTGDVWAVVVVAVAATTAVVAAYRPLLFTTFDAEVARASGVRVDRYDALLMVLLSAAVLTTMKVLGVVLVAATLVTPAATARLLTDRFSRMLWLSAVLGAVAGFAGMNVSYHLDVSSGATIVLVASALFVVALGVSAFRWDAAGARRRVR